LRGKTRGGKKISIKKAHAQELKGRKKSAFLPVETFIKVKSPPKRAAKLFSRKKAEKNLKDLNV